MKVLLLTLGYPPILTSAARLFSELAEGLAACGHEITVLTTVPERYLDDKDAAAIKTIPERETKNGIEVHRLRMFGLPKQVPFLRGMEHLLYGLQYFMHGRGLGHHDVVIAYSPPLPLAISAARLAHEWESSSIMNIQDLYPQEAIDLGLLRNEWLIRIGHYMEKWAYKHIDAITVYSDANRDYVIQKGVNPDKIYVIANWIALNKYKPGPRKNSFRSSYGLEDAFVLSYAGVMGFAQGLGDVLKAAVRLEQEIPGFVLILAGSGVELPKLKELSKELGLKNVRFIPHIPEDEYIALLQASDVCLVTLDKNLTTPIIPGKLSCIMGIGRPAVCNLPATADAWKIVEESKSGLCAESGDYEALADAVLRIYRDPAMRADMELNGRRYAESYFDCNHSIEQYDQLLLELNQLALKRDKKEG
jgi:glycosyltransferase involved in cell wall biosynthesis